MPEHTSCLGCKWMFTRDTGYSNYTVLDTEAHCVHDRNPKLPADIPDEVRKWGHIQERDYNYVWMKPKDDKWHATKDGRCDLYEYTEEQPYHIDCDGDDIVAIHDGRRMLTEEANPLPLLVAIYYGKKESDHA